MRRRAKKTFILVLLILAALAAAASCFLMAFYVPDEQAEVQGNMRYTDAEIRRMAMPGFPEHNSLYLRFFRHDISLPDIPFIDSIEVEYLARDRVRLHANEEYPVGYLLEDGLRFYFNVAGIVTESLDDETQKSEEERAKAAAAKQKQENAGLQENGEDPAGTEPLAAEGVADGSAEPLMAEEARADSGIKKESDTAFRPALTDVSQVSGLTDVKPAVGDQIQVQDPAIFQTLLTLGKLANKLNIHPDEILVDPDQTLTLRYGEVLVDIGTDRLLDEKMSRAAAILPQLEGMRGTLHLENYSSSTINIIFSEYREEPEEEYIEEYTEEEYIEEYPEEEYTEEEYMYE